MCTGTCCPTPRSTCAACSTTTTPAVSRTDRAGFLGTLARVEVADTDSRVPPNAASSSIRQEYAPQSGCRGWGRVLRRVVTVTAATSAAAVVLAVALAAPPPPPSAASNLPQASAEDAPPDALALPSGGRWGSVLRLRYVVLAADLPVARTIFVFRNGTRVTTIRARFSKARPGRTYSVRWRAPAARKAKARKAKWSFCVLLTDRRGETSDRSCAAIWLR